MSSVGEVEVGRLRRLDMKNPIPPAIIRTAMPPIAAPVMTPAPMGFDLEVDDVVKFDELFA